MYTDYYALTGRPFQLSPNPRFFFASRAHRRAVASISLGLQQGEGLLVISGEVGSGKTTLSSYLQEQLGHRRLAIASVATAGVGAETLPTLIARALRLEPERVPQEDVLGLIERDLRDRQAERRRVLLVADEAQNLSVEALKVLCRLTYLVQDGQTPLQLLLLGPPSFRDLLAGPALERVRQFVVASAHLGALGPDEVRSYMEHRLRLVGWRDVPSFEPAIFDEIFAFSRGLPRLVNLIAARLLVHGSIEQRDRLTAAEARDLAQELALETTAWADVSVPQPSGAEPAPAWTDVPLVGAEVGDPRREIQRLRLKLEAVFTELGLERRRSEELRGQVERLTRALHQMELDHLRIEAATSRRLADILVSAGTQGQVEPERKGEQTSVHVH